MRIPTIPSSTREVLSILILVLVAPSAHGLPVPNVIPHSPPVWTASGQPSVDVYFGTSAAPAGDVNDDGYDDVLVGSPGTGPESHGKAFLYFGGPSGLSTTPAWTVVGHQYWGQLGYSVSSAGDFNRDGYGDIAISELDYSGTEEDEGRVMVFFGSRRGIQPGPDWEVLGTDFEEELGQVVASAGDVNGDGADDLLILSHNASRVFYGHPGRPDNDPDWTGPASPVGTGIGDVNGDRFDDVAIETATGTEVYLGSSSGLSSSPSWVGPYALSVSGRGDVNGDGIADLLLGPQYTYERRVRLYLGSPRGLGPTPYREDFGGLYVSLGDVNGDGHADIAVASESSVDVYLSELGIPSLLPDWRADLGTYARLAIIALGADVDGDGSMDVLTSNPNAYVQGTFAGQAYLYKLGPAYPAPAILHESPSTLIAPSSPVALQAIATDWTHAVDRVEIHYRYIEDFDEQAPVTMQRTGTDQFSGTIPPPSGYTAGLVYFIRAYDDYGLAGETELVGIDYDYGMIARSGGLSTRVRSGPDGSAAEIAFTMTRRGPVTLRVFDVAGRLVATLLRETSLAPGEHRVPVGAATLRSGVFFYRLETAEGTRSGRLVRLPVRE